MKSRVTTPSSTKEGTKPRVLPSAITDLRQRLNRPLVWTVCYCIHLETGRTVINETEACPCHNCTCGVVCILSRRNISFTEAIGRNQSPSSSLNLICRSIAVIKSKEIWSSQLLIQMLEVLTAVLFTLCFRRSRWRSCFQTRKFQNTLLNAWKQVLESCIEPGKAGHRTQSHENL